MTSQIWGGGVVFALVVLLWFVWLIPGLRRQHKYRATARNAERLQRTLRVLAENGDGPTEITVDASPEDVAEQKRILREAELREGTSRRARRAAALATWRVRLARQRVRRAQAATSKHEERRRMQERRMQQRSEETQPGQPAAGTRAVQLASARRRARLAATAVLLLSVPMLGAGVAAVVGGSGATLLLSGLVLAGLAVAALARMAIVAERAAQRMSGMPVVAEQAEPAPLYDQDAGRLEEPRIASHRPLWTAEPLPEALQSTQGSLADETLARAEAQEALRQAARAQVMAEMAAARQKETVQQFADAERARERALAEKQAEDEAARRAEQERAARADNPFATMGRVGEYDSTTDVSDILRRRRNAG